MRCKYLFLFSVLMLVSCTEKVHFETLRTEVNQEIVKANAEATLGITIDPSQTWSSIQAGSISVKADAELEDIVKVQILTEPPYGNENAAVLSEKAASWGEEVTLAYEAPSVYTRLYAACVNSEGIYYIKGFDVGTTKVNFNSTNRTRAALGWDGVRLPGAFKIARSWDSFNKQRTLNGWGLWAGSGWNDKFYALADDWEQNLIQTVDNFTADEKKDLEAIFDKYLQRDASKVDKSELINGRPDNLGKIKASSIFSMNNNYLTSNGQPLTVTPVGMASFETREGCHLYYYYFDPAIMAGKSSDEQVQILKNLPKYKAEQCWRLGSKVGDGKTYGNDEIFRAHVYYCPYYGDETPVVGQTVAKSFSIPAGYNIGFVQRMEKNNNYTHSKTGELYGDGRLNNEINLLPDHFTSAKLAPNDPRQAIFSVNGKTYITFEDGSDRQFSDLIIEIGSGVDVKKVEEPQQPEAAAYTMCFEDRPHVADYDMNDVVLQCVRVDETTLQIGLIACGAADEVVLHGLDGSRLLNNCEIHNILHIPEGTFANTVKNGQVRMAVAEFITTNKSIEEYMQGIYIENLTTGQTIRTPNQGEAPSAILVPYNFNYPMEGESIKKAYPGFLEWAHDKNTSKDWYTLGNADLIYPNLFR